MSVGSDAILVVSEANSTETAIVSSLENSGYLVDVVTAADRCLPAIKVKKPDLIIWSLLSRPDISVLGCIKSKYKNLPVILHADKDSMAQVVTLLNHDADDYFAGGESDSELLNQIVLRTLDNARKKEKMRILEQDQLAGLRVQQGLLPATPATLGGFEFAHFVRPSLIMSGDSVNYVQLGDGRVIFYLADVSGHGASGAIVSAIMSGLFQRLVRKFQHETTATSADMLDWINVELLPLNLEQHITMFLGILNGAQNALQYSNAAHFPAGIVSNDESTLFLELGGLPLGVCDTEYGYHDISIDKSFNLVVFSDGVLEIMSEESIKGKEMQLHLLVQSGNTDIDTLVDHLGLDEISEVPDDVALLTVVRKS